MVVGVIVVIVSCVIGDDLCDVGMLVWLVGDIWV